MIDTVFKTFIKVVYTILFLIVMLVWVIDLFLYEDFWICSKCRDGETASPVPLFLYFSMWNVWWTMATFITWAYFTDSDQDNKKVRINRNQVVAERLFCVAFPLVATVTTTWIYYILSNPVSAITNEDVCYTAVRSSVPRDFGEEFAQVYLVLAITSDITIYYACSLLMLGLYFTGEIYFAATLPFSTLFAFILGMIIAIVQESGTHVYCGDVWFHVGMVWMFTIIYHVLFFLFRGRSADDVPKEVDVFESTTFTVHKKPGEDDVTEIETSEALTVQRVDVEQNEEPNIYSGPAATSNKEPDDVKELESSEDPNVLLVQSDVEQNDPSSGDANASNDFENVNTIDWPASGEANVSTDVENVDSSGDSNDLPSG